MPPLPPARPSPRRGARDAAVTPPTRALDPGLALALPLAFAVALAALRPAALGPSAHRGDAVDSGAPPGFSSSGRPCSSSPGRQQRAAGAGDRAAQAALPAGLRAVLGHAVLGLVLARGLPLAAPDRRAAPLRLRLRHAARRGRDGETYTLGFGPFPIVFSINLFLWFKPDWFYLQFLMVAVGFLAKEFIRWEKDGRARTSSIPRPSRSASFSLGLILTGTTGITWGQEIAQTFELPPHIRLCIFLVGLPGQFLFGVTTMTMSAVVAVFGFGLAYYWIFGTYFFVDAFIPGGRVPRHAPAVHRPVDVAAHRARAHPLRRALRPGRRRPVRAARTPRRPDVLRQAAGRPADEHGDPADRRGGAVAACCDRSIRRGSARR